MTVFEINSVPYGSTGRIMFQLAQAVQEQGGTAYTSASFTKPRGERFPSTYHRIGGPAGKTAHILLAKLTGRHGCYSHWATYGLIQKIRQVQPDVIHLHNIHGWYLNWRMLFGFLKQAGIPVVWTLHDCWAFTGHCPHFIAEDCVQWKTGCTVCPRYRQYPGCFFDDAEKQYALKKQCFTGIPDLTIVTPSRWLAELAGQSFLKEYPTAVIPNGIDLTLFQPVQSDFRARCGLEKKVVLLGVAFDWGVRKGLEEFIRLASELPDEYAIVLVGVSPELRKQLPERILAIACTQSQRELAEIYSAADLFVNPTLEDNFPTVNLEALACGTPVLTYRTGGSPESLSPETGSVVPYGDYPTLKQAILEMKKGKAEKQAACRKQAERFSRQEFCKRYLALYENLKKDRAQ